MAFIVHDKEYELKNGKELYPVLCNLAGRADACYNKLSQGSRRKLIREIQFQVYCIQNRIIQAEMDIRNDERRREV